MHKLFIVLCAFAFCADSGSAHSEEQPILIMVQTTNIQSLDHAIMSAFSQPPFERAPARTAGVLILFIPEKVKEKKSNGGAVQWEFTVKFSRDGTSLGESYEACSTTKLVDCTNQLRMDAAAAVGREMPNSPTREK